MSINVVSGVPILMPGGRWAYQWFHRKKPHLHPVCTPSGHRLTRQEPADHPWHRGIWFTIKYVNGENFWEEAPPYGVLRHQGPMRVDGGEIAGTLQWIRPDKETVVITQRLSLRHVELADDAYAIDLTTTLAPHADVTLDRTEFTTWGGYGGLSLRGNHEWVDTRLLFDDGTEHDRVTPKRSAWCDLSGTVDSASGATGGIAILDAPANPRHPVPFYASTRAATYGDEGWSNFCNAAFLFEEPLDLAAGQELHFDYRLVVHDGVWDAERVAAAHADWSGGGR